jgi:hypothetical protein
LHVFVSGQSALKGAACLRFAFGFNFFIGRDAVRIADTERLDIAIDQRQRRELTHER